MFRQLFKAGLRQFQLLSVPFQKEKTFKSLRGFGIFLFLTAQENIVATQKNLKF